jgi:hypothetical protein
MRWKHGPGHGSCLSQIPRHGNSLLLSVPDVRTGGWHKTEWTLSVYITSSVGWLLGEDVVDKRTRIHRNATIIASSDVTMATSLFELHDDINFYMTFVKL